MGSSRLTDEQLHALQKISSIGMSHAATALSQLLRKTIRLQVPRVLAMDNAHVPEFLGGKQQMVVGVYLRILGDACGNIMMVFTRDNAHKILDKLLSRTKSKGALLTELEVSALKEVGNILASAYLNALGDMLKLTIIPSVPVLSFDVAGTVVDYVLTELGETGETSLMIETAFSEDKENISGHFFLLPDSASLDMILKKICV